jgi:1-acyl-sn-glycerol-3-phosphate acyltransferase
MFLIHDSLKWVGMLGWGIEMGGSVVVGRMLGEKFASLKTTELQHEHLRQPQIILPAAAA